MSWNEMSWVGVERGELREVSWIRRVGWVEWFEELCDMSWVRVEWEGLNWVGIEWAELLDELSSLNFVRWIDLSRSWVRRVEWDELCKLGWVSWVVRDGLGEMSETSEMSCVSRVEWVELCEVGCVRWVKCDELINWVEFCERNYVKWID